MSDKTKRRNTASWTTTDEIKALNYMASSEARSGGAFHSVAERIVKLHTWRRTAYSRTWPESVEVSRCDLHAQDLLAALMVMRTGEAA